MREDWLRSQDRRRRLGSWGLTAAGYLLVAGLVLAVEGFRVEEVSDFAGPVMISLGSPEGSAAPGAEAPTVAPALPAPPEPAPPPTPPPADPKAVSASPAATPPPKPAPKPAAKPAPAPPAPAQVASQPAPPAPPAPPAAVKGSEAGNDYETNFGGSSDRVARSFYVPIYRYMPPPLYVSEAVAARVPGGAAGSKSPMGSEERKRIFQASYARSADGWMLKAPVALRARDALWFVLEDAGYDVAKADYKAGKPLKPVVLMFTVAPGKAGAMPSLEDLRVVESSGYADIDEAVLYGFRQAGFSSTADRPVTGRFVYRF
ncbi:MAG: hypothetical protein JNG85_05220 [Spirochaetaceae bacterium]|nr:hypothetical protein [Spirochaetaceae bacterium]